MLSEASDYSYVDVSKIEVAGKILPVRDKEENGSWCVLKAEDAAYLAEMVCERNNEYGASFRLNVYGGASIKLRWRYWLSQVAGYLRFRAFELKERDNEGVVEKEYEFEPEYGISQSERISKIYEDAFIVTPSMDYGTDNPYVIKANIVRTMFYDLSRVVRFWSKADGIDSGVVHYTNDRLATESDQESDYHYEEDRDEGAKWELEAEGYGESWYSIQKKTIKSVSCRDIFRLNQPHNAECITEVVAFVRIYTYINNNGISWWAGDSYEDIIPVKCEKAEGKWNLPTGFFTNEIAEAAIRRHGGDPTVTPGRYPEDTTGMTRKAKSIMVDWDVDDVVYLYEFPSDISELGWDWTPEASVEDEQE